MTTDTKPRAPCFSIHLEPAPTSDAGDLAKDAQRLADQLGVIAEYDFNGVRCMAFPGGSAKNLHESCMRQLHSPSKNKVASS